MNTNFDDLPRYNFCPVCGEKSKVGSPPHKCSEKKLRAIDAAHRGASLEPSRGERFRHFGERLSEGFLMLSYDSPARKRA